MARTNIKVFDEGYKNIMNDDEYNLSVQRTRGVTPGIADPLMHNKLYRQVSVMSTALAQYIVDQGYDCLDTDLIEIASNIKNATIKTMLDRLKEGNLTLGDGITANGNFNINRKLTVNEIDCKTNLTIGGQKPLDSSAIEKLQNQIISPTQTIFVDAYKGSDETNDGTEQKPFRTLDKANDSIKINTPYVIIYLRVYDDESKNIYTMTKPINSSVDNLYNNPPKSLTRLNISTFWADFVNTGYKLAKITVPYTKCWFGQYDSKGILYAYGNMFALAVPEINLSRLSIDLSNPKSTDTSISLNSVLVGGDKVHIDDCIINLADNCSLINIQNQNLSVVNIFAASRIKGSGWISSCLRPPSVFYDNWDGSNPNPKTAPSMQGISSIISVYILNELARIDTTITNKANGGFGNNVKVGVKNF